jgi:hypothetical protein
VKVLLRLVSRRIVLGFANALFTCVAYTTTIGPLQEVPAALCFYRALRVYPSPVELIMSK